MTDYNYKHKILLDSDWTKDGEADDIIKYYTRQDMYLQGYELIILTNKELEAIDYKSFFSGTVFGNSNIIQQKIRASFDETDANTIIPDTYDSAFTQFFKRPIEIITLAELRVNHLANSDARFIKPIGNDKLFDGQVVLDCDDLDDLFSKHPTINYDTQVYSCQPIEIQGELRLLIGDGKLYGKGQISIANPPNHDYLIPGGFLDQLCATAGDRYLCIDIGWIPQIGSWIIVEINPPFGLDEYDIPLADYTRFTEDVFKWIRLKLGLVSS